MSHKPEITIPSFLPVNSPLKIRKGDVYIVCGGFEERAETVLQTLTQSEENDCFILLIEYEPYLNLNPAVESVAMSGIF